MKKIIYTIIALFLSLTFVNAKEFCTVVSGNGTDIGSEIACDTEHFYVIENDGENTKMLAKYNLYVGRNFNIEKLPQTFTNYWNANNYVMNNYDTSKYSGFSILSSNHDGIYDYFRYHVTITEDDKDYGIQNEKALSAHGGEKGEPEYPIYASYWANEFTRDFLIDSIEYSTELYQDFVVSRSVLNDNLQYYSNYLEKAGYSIENIDLLTVNDIKNVVDKVSNKKMPIDEWTPDKWVVQGDYSYKVGSLKDYLPSGYEWLYSTTYWTRTVVNPGKVTNDENFDDRPYVYFIDTLGDICNAQFCNATDIFAGVRPYVVIANDSIIYKVNIKTNGHGSVVASKTSANKGTEITFVITPDEGYVLGSVKVTDGLGNIIYFTDNKFTMPNADVLIEVTFVPKSPETSTLISIGIIFLFIISLVAILYFYKKHEKKLIK